MRSYNPSAMKSMWLCAGFHPGCPEEEACLLVTSRRLAHLLRIIFLVLLVSFYERLIGDIEEVLTLL